MERYTSGTSLVKTSKEADIDCFERMVGQVGDALYVGLKKLTIAELRLLHKAVAGRIDAAYDTAARLATTGHEGTAE